MHVNEEPTVRANKPPAWIDEALENPANEYATPAEVLRDERLDLAGMRAVLVEWERAARQRVMAGAQTPELRDVEAAIIELDRREGLAS